MKNSFATAGIATSSVALGIFVAVIGIVILAMFIVGPEEFQEMLSEAEALACRFLLK